MKLNLKLNFIPIDIVLIILIHLNLIQYCQLEIADCLMEEYSLKNTLALGVIKNKLYQYTLYHEWVKYDFIFPNNKNTDYKRYSPPLNIQFNLTNGIAQPFANVFESSNNKLFKLLQLMTPDQLLSTMTFTVQVNENKGYSVFIYLKQAFLVILEIPIVPANQPIITNLNFENYDRIIPIWMSEKLVAHRFYYKFDLVIESSGLVSLYGNGVMGDRLGFLCWDVPFTENIIFLETVKSESCYKSSLFFEPIRFAFVLPNILYLVDIDRNQVNYELTFPIFPGHETNYTIHNNSNKEFQCHYSYNPFKHLYFFIFITFVIFLIMLGLFFFYVILNKNYQRIKMNERLFYWKMMDKNRIKRYSPTNQTSSPKEKRSIPLPKIFINIILI